MELFKIGFLSVKLMDIIDILIVTYVFFKLYMVMKGTVASQIFIALVLILIFSFIAQLIDLQATGWLLSRITDIWVIALIILFQPEIRRLLLLIGKTRLGRLFTKGDVDESINEISEACIDLKNRGWGALIVIERSSGLKSVMETGELVQSRINKEMIISIFSPNSPLHDGAVIIKNDRIEAARCLLPLSDLEKIMNKRLGTRHRAGIGITEVSDAVAVIVSEERKTISIAVDGNLEIVSDSLTLKEKLKNLMGMRTVAGSMKEILKETGSEVFDKTEDQKDDNPKQQ
ncbi:MAG: TIGR00159 family protein [Ignavibacteria bacterium]|nr:TIGR00159 family protein [Ignavibacteria bacterium]